MTVVLTTTELQAILAKHVLWLNGDPNGRRANLSGANLHGVKLRGVKLREADLTEADLRGADLIWADMSGADIREADLTEADLRGAILRGANLDGRTPLYADTTRSYVLYVLPECSEPMFVAGCRCFTEAEARRHWRLESMRAQPAYIAAINKWKASQ